MTIGNDLKDLLLVQIASLSDLLQDLITLYNFINMSAIESTVVAVKLDLENKNLPLILKDIIDANPHIKNTIAQKFKNFSATFFDKEFNIDQVDCMTSFNDYAEQNAIPEMIWFTGRLLSELRKEASGELSDLNKVKRISLVSIATVDKGRELVGYHFAKNRNKGDDKRLKNCPYCRKYFIAKDKKRKICYEKKCINKYHKDDMKKRRDINPVKYC